MSTTAPSAGADSAPEFLSAQQVSKIIGVATKTLAHWRGGLHEGPPFVKLPSGAVRYSRRDLMRWMDLGLVTPHKYAEWMERKAA
jgi:predicted DNA-binding transcriptional regulator AlpA